MMRGLPMLAWLFVSVAFVPSTNANSNVRLSYSIDGFRWQPSSSSLSRSSSTSAAISKTLKRLSGGNISSTPYFRLPWTKQAESPVLIPKKKKSFFSKVEFEIVPPDPVTVKKLVDDRLDAANDTRRFYEDNPEKAKSMSLLLSTERLPAIGLLAIVLGPLMDLLGLLEEDPSVVLLRKKRAAERHARALAREAHKAATNQKDKTINMFLDVMGFLQEDQETVMLRQQRTAEHRARALAKEARRAVAQRKKQKAKRKPGDTRVPETQLEEYSLWVEDKVEEDIRPRMLDFWRDTKDRLLVGLLENGVSTLNEIWDNFVSGIKIWWGRATSEGGLFDLSTWTRNPFEAIMDAPPGFQCAVGLAVGLISWPLAWSLGATTIKAGSTAYLLSEMYHLLVAKGGGPWLQDMVGDETYETLDRTLGKVRETKRKDGFYNDTTAVDIITSIEQELDERHWEFPTNVVRGVVVGVAVGILTGA